MTWHPHPDVWFLVAGVLGAYFGAIKVWGPRLAPPFEPAATRGQRTSFLLGTMAIWFASDWPVHDLGEGYLYSVHMIQHLILTLVAPPLLLMGTPAWMLRALLHPRALMELVRRLARPVPALVIFNAVIVLTHWPWMVDFILRNHPFHFVSHAALFCAASLMWTPVVSPLLELPRLSYPGRMFYLFLQSIVPTVPASFLTFADSTLYKFYDTVPRLWGIAALSDQRVAGLIMKIAGGFILWGVIAVLFFKWHALEEREGIDALQWRDVERELNRASPWGDETAEPASSPGSERAP